MKGISEIIAIILILMIVVALAALAYTWFSSLSTSLMTTTSNASTNTANAMSTNFRIEVAKNQTGATPCFNISVTIRCLGTYPINVSQMSAYINDVTGIIGGTGITTPISYGVISTFYITNSSPAQSACNATGTKLRLDTATGLEQSITVT